MWRSLSSLITHLNANWKQNKHPVRMSIVDKQCYVSWDRILYEIWNIYLSAISPYWYQKKSMRDCKLIDQEFTWVDLNFDKVIWGRLIFGIWGNLRCFSFVVLPRPFKRGGKLCKQNFFSLREAAKKSSSLNGLAIKA